MNKAAAALGSTAAGFAVVLGMHAASSPAALAGAGPGAKSTAPSNQGAGNGANGRSSTGGTGTGGTGTGGTTAAGTGNAGTGSGGATVTTSPPPTGPAASAVGTAEQYGYGVLSVKVSVHGHHIVDVSLANIQVAESYSQMLAQQVVPMLRQEVLQAQSAQVNGVSGATYTSEAYLYSVQSALDKLHV